MNAVVKSVPAAPAAAALEAYHERVRVIRHDTEPLRSRLHAQRTNIAAAETDLARAGEKLAETQGQYEAAIAAAPTGAHRDLVERLARCRQEVDGFGLRLSDLRRAAGDLEAQIGRIESRIQHEPKPLLVLQQEAFVEGPLQDALRRLERADAELAAAEREAYAHAQAADSVAMTCENRHHVAPVMRALPLRLERVRVYLERHNAGLVEDSLQRQREQAARVAALSKEIEAT